MPKGSPSKQTNATEKFAQKANIIAKNYKLKKDVAEEFALVCEKAGVSQTGQLMKMVIRFSERVNGRIE